MGTNKVKLDRNRPHRSEEPQSHPYLDLIECHHDVANDYTKLYSWSSMVKLRAFGIHFFINLGYTFLKWREGIIGQVIER